MAQQLDTSGPYRLARFAGGNEGEAVGYLVQQNPPSTVFVHAGDQSGFPAWPTGCAAPVLPAAP